MEKFPDLSRPGLFPPGWRGRRERERRRALDDGAAQEDDARYPCGCQTSAKRNFTVLENIDSHSLV